MVMQSYAGFQVNLPNAYRWMEKADYTISLPSRSLEVNAKVFLLQLYRYFLGVWRNSDAERAKENKSV